MTLRVRIWTAVGSGALLAFATWSELTEPVPFSSSDAAAFLLLGVAIVAGLVIGRWWVLATLIGPFLVMFVLEVSGYYTHDYLEWGTRPLFSPPGIAFLVWLALAMAIGVVGSKGVAAFSSWRRRGGGRRPRDREARGRPAAR